MGDAQRKLAHLGFSLVACKPAMVHAARSELGANNNDNINIKINDGKKVVSFINRMMAICQLATISTGGYQWQSWIEDSGNNVASLLRTLL